MTLAFLNLSLSSYKESYYPKIVKEVDLSSMPDLYILLEQVIDKVKKEEIRKGNVEPTIFYIEIWKNKEGYHCIIRCPHGFSATTSVPGYMRIKNNDIFFTDRWNVSLPTTGYFRTLELNSYIDQAPRYYSYFMPLLFGEDSDLRTGSRIPDLYEIIMRNHINGDSTVNIPSIQK